MIVFSATHKASGRVFVGSCRVDLDFHWAMLLTQAEEGVVGPLYDLLRTEGADSFDVAEYADADNARELSALCREAQEELQAELIRSVAQRKEASTGFDKTLLEGADDDSDDDLDGWLQDRRQQQQQPLQKPEPAQVDPAPVSVALRQTKSTEDAADMRAVIAGIEARRKSQLKSSTPAKTVRAKAKASSAKPAAVGKGKVESAAARERRIKAALAEEKAAREAAKQRKVAAEADEMAALMARLDARTKVAESIRRRR